MGLLTKFLQVFKAQPASYTGYSLRSSPFAGDEWDHDVFRATVDAIATHAAKGTAKHVIVDKDGRIKKVLNNSPYARLLNMSPNPIMSGFEFKYRMIAQLETKNTAIAYIKWDGNIPEMICPVDYQKFEFYEIIGGGYAIKFLDFEGHEIMLNLADCIFVRKFYNVRTAAGDGNEPIYKVFDMSKASDEGFIECLQVSNKVRGLHKQKKAMLAPEDVQKSQDEFAARFKKAAEEGGVVSLDSMEEYVPLSAGNTFAANASQLAAINERIFMYLRTPKEIVMSNYSEQVGLAWYESVIEPLWEMFSEAITNACFTSREKGVGNKIIFSGGVMMGTSLQTRVNVITSTKELGTMTLNEQRELLGLPPIEDGDVRLVSLNFVNAEHQDEYQVGKGADQKEGENAENNK